MKELAIDIIRAMSDEPRTPPGTRRSTGDAKNLGAIEDVDGFVDGGSDSEGRV
jgi:hypothetical protein